jgi:CheY-like chemotaxis protein
MSSSPRNCTILLADDDADDCLLVAEALREAGHDHMLQTVRDGEQLLDYMRRRGSYADPAVSPRPALLLLDLKMPRKDGREALRELKADSVFRALPIVVFTTSTAPDDIGYCYRHGANSYITKPATYRAMVELMRDMMKYWFDIVKLQERV